MSTHTYAVDPSSLERIARGADVVGLPDRVVLADTAGVTLTFEADLDAAQVATLDLVVQAADASLPTALYDSVRPHVQTIRDLRQMGRNAFMALTAAERDRLIYDAQTATTTILLALLRD